MVNLRKTELYELNDAYQKVLIWFYSFPSEEVGLTELTEHLKISKTTANRIVNRLVKEEFLNVRIFGKVWRISVKGNHRFNNTRKVSHNLTMIYESGIIEEIHRAIQNPKAIVLFGSYRKGDDTEKSDIDIAVETADSKALRIIQLGVIPKLGYRTNIPVTLHVFSRNKVDINLFSNIANGIVLEGFLEARP